MFTRIMYTVINEITRQPGYSEAHLQAARGPRRGAVSTRTRIQAPLRAGARALPGRYGVLADSFMRAAGFRA